jgi:transcription termination factor 2
MSEHALGENPKQMRDTGVKLWDYQLEGVGLLAWMESQSPHGAILADEMGLGKTKQVAALVISQGGHTLIVCPVGLMSVWEAEFMEENCSPPLRVLVHHGFKKAKSSTELREKYDVVVTSYETLQFEHKRYLDVENAFQDLQQGKPGNGSRPYLPLIAHKGWHRLVLDEAHKIRSLDKSFALAVQQVKATRRIAITGSPFNNSYMDLCSLFRSLRLEPWNDASLFRKVRIYHVQNT